MFAFCGAGCALYAGSSTLSSVFPLLLRFQKEGKRIYFTMTFTVRPLLYLMIFKPFWGAPMRCPAAL